MKKRLLLFISIVGITFASALFFHSCELEDGCASCKLVTTQADGSESSGLAVIFCDEELDEKESETPVTINDVTTEWVCE